MPVSRAMPQEMAAGCRHAGTSNARRAGSRTVRAVRRTGGAWLAAWRALSAWPAGVRIPTPCACCLTLLQAAGAARRPGQRRLQTLSVGTRGFAAVQDEAGNVCTARLEMQQSARLAPVPARHDLPALCGFCSLLVTPHTWSPQQGVPSYRSSAQGASVSEASIAAACRPSACRSPAPRGEAVWTAAICTPSTGDTRPEAGLSACS